MTGQERRGGGGGVGQTCDRTGEEGRGGGGLFLCGRGVFGGGVGGKVGVHFRRARGGMKERVYPRTRGVGWYPLTRGVGWYPTCCGWWCLMLSSPPSCTAGSGRVWRHRERSGHPQERPGVPTATCAGAAYPMPQPRSAHNTRCWEGAGTLVMHSLPRSARTALWDSHSKAACCVVLDGRGAV